jgi:hypothetical protein
MAADRARHPTTEQTEVVPGSAVEPAERELLTGDSHHPHLGMPAGDPDHRPGNDRRKVRVLGGQGHSDSSAS